MSRLWLTLVDSASDTVGEVKARVGGATGVPTAQMSLAYGGTALSSDSATLGGVGVPDGGLLTLAISGSVPAAAYAVVVALPTSLQPALGSTLTVATAATATVGSLKSTLEETLGVSAAAQTLSFGGVTLASSGATLGSVGIAHLDTVVLTVPSAGSVRTVRVELPSSVASTFGAEMTVGARCACGDA